MKKFLAVIIFLLISNLSFADNGGYILSADVIDLPWLRGSETSNDLEFAATSDEELKTLIKEMTLKTDVCELYNNFDELISKWLGENKTGEEMHKIVLFKLVKEDVSKYKPENIEKVYQLWKEHWFLNFVFQMEWGYKLGVKYEYFDDKLVYDDKVYENIVKNMTSGDDFLLSYLLAKKLAIQNELDVEKLGSAISKYGYGAHVISFINSRKDFSAEQNEKPVYFIGTSGEDKINGDDEPDIIYGRDGDDVLNGYGGDDWISGGKGNDKLYGGDGSDILIGNEGNNKLYGGGGDDIYIYNGEGNDTISDEKWAAIKLQKWYWDASISDFRDKWVDKGKTLINGGNDTVIFGENIDKDKLEIRHVANDLVFITDNKILTLKNWFASENQRVENFRFFDGTRLDTYKFYELKRECAFKFFFYSKIFLWTKKNFGVKQKKSWSRLYQHTECG